MTLSIDFKCSNIDVYPTGGDLWVNATNAKLRDNVSADIIVTEYGATSLLDAIGGFEDWLYEGGINTEEVAEWLAGRGYTIERN